MSNKHTNKIKDAFQSKNREPSNSCKEKVIPRHNQVHNIFHDRNKAGCKFYQLGSKMLYKKLSTLIDQCGKNYSIIFKRFKRIGDYIW